MIRPPGAFFEDVARVALILLPMVGVACLLPPEGEPIRVAQSPIVASEEITPSLGVQFISAGDEATFLNDDPDGRCRSIALRVPGISDPDSDTLLLRLVANNGQPDASVIDDDPERTDEDGNIPPYIITFDPGDHFGQTILEAARLGPRAATLTLFITDGVAWASTPNDRPDDDDFARVIDDTVKPTRLDWLLFFTKDRNEACPS